MIAAPAGDEVGEAWTDVRPPAPAVEQAEVADVGLGIARPAIVGDGAAQRLGGMGLASTGHRVEGPFHCHQGTGTSTDACAPAGCG